jgi:CRISPR-associated protein Cas1
MTDRILDLSDRPACLSVRNSLLVVRFGEEQPVTVPLDDLAVVITSHPEISYTHAVLSGLARAGAAFIACDEKHLPAAMLLPLVTHSLQTERFAKQARIGLPTRKRLWQRIVQEKLLAQARFLQERACSDSGLAMMAARVRSGDPQNLEAQAARIYWRALFGDIHFRRDPQSGESLNPCLNYGYAILRAVVARAACAAGLHPSLGIHHHNRYNAFCLADDLMEPFRPVVDRAVAKLKDDWGEKVALDRESKHVILESVLARYAVNEESRTLFDWINRAAFSLADAIIAQAHERLDIPRI